MADLPASTLADPVRQSDGSTPLVTDEARSRGLLQWPVSGLSHRPLDQWLADIAATSVPTSPSLKPRPLLVVLPGIMGSELSEVDAGADAAPIWLSMTSLLNGRLSRLDLASPHTLQPCGLMSLAYERLLRTMQGPFHVVPFAFDWRRALPDTAAQLIDLLHRLLPQAQRLGVPVHLLAHSMGGLVARLALWCDDFGLAARRGDLTRQLEGMGLRMVQCGTPNQGSYAPLQLLMQQDRLTGHVARLALGVTARDLARFGASYPGLMAMMPVEPDPRFGDLFQPSRWTVIKAADAANIGTDEAITVPDKAVLAEAAKVRDWLRGSFDTLKANPRVFYVAGRGLTPLHLKVIGGSPIQPGLLRLGVTPLGDGTVPWASALAPERTFYIECGHGSLLDHPETFDGLQALLLDGKTTQLPAQPPRLRSDPAALADAVFELPAPPARLDRSDDLAAHVLGLDRAAPLPTPTPTPMRRPGSRPAKRKGAASQQPLEQSLVREADQPCRVTSRRPSRRAR